MLLMWHQPNSLVRQFESFLCKIDTRFSIFFISNSQFIERAYFKYMEKYTQSRLRIAKCYVQVDDDSQNLVMELQLVKPHNQDQSNNNLEKNSIKYVLKLSKFSYVQPYAPPIVSTSNIRELDSKYEKTVLQVGLSPDFQCRKS